MDKLWNVYASVSHNNHDNNTYPSPKKWERAELSIILISLYFPGTDTNPLICVFFFICFHLFRIIMSYVLTFHFLSLNGIVTAFTCWQTFKLMLHAGYYKSSYAYLCTSLCTHTLIPLGQVRAEWLGDRVIIC